MTPVSRAATTLGLALATAGPLWAADGQIGGFGASATQVTAGSTVDFWVSYSVNTEWSSWGGNDINEPPPQEGSQFWQINWYGYNQQLLQQVWLQAGDQSFSDWPVLSPGSSWSGSWSFSMSFPDPGQYSVSLNGGWTGMGDYFHTTESATRNCFYGDPESPVLYCDWWIYNYQTEAYTYSIDGNFGPQSLTIEVLAAPVPEAPTAALWLAGGAALLAWRRRRRG